MDTPVQKTMTEQKEVAFEKKKSRREIVELRKAANRTGQDKTTIVGWKSLSHEGLKKEFTDYAKGKKPAEIHARQQAMHRVSKEALDMDQPDWDYFDETLDMGGDQGTGFGIGLANFTHTIQFASRTAPEGGFKSLEQLQEFWRSIELCHNEFMDPDCYQNKVPYEDTIKHFIMKVSAGLKFLPTYQSACRFAMNCMKTDKRFDGYAISAIAALHASALGAESTTDYSNLKVAVCKRQVHWTTSALIQEYNSLSHGDPISKRAAEHIKKELLDRCTPEYKQKFLDIVNEKSTPQYHRWMSWKTKNYYLRSYILETEQIQSHNRKLAEWYGVYTRYREDIVYIPYNVYIYTKFTVPTDEQYLTIQEMFPFEEVFRNQVPPSESHTSDRNATGTAGDEDSDEEADESEGTKVKLPTAADLFIARNSKNLENVVHASATHNMDQAHEAPEGALRIGKPARNDKGSHIFPEVASFGDIPMVLAAIGEQVQTALDKSMVQIDKAEHMKLIENINETSKRANKLFEKLEDPIDKLKAATDYLNTPSVKKSFDRHTTALGRMFGLGDDVALFMKPITSMVSAYIPTVIYELPGFKEMLAEFPWLAVILTFIGWRKTNCKIMKSILIGNLLVQFGGVKILTTLISAVWDYIAKSFHTEKAEGTSGPEEQEEKNAQGTAGDLTPANMLTGIWEFIKSYGLQAGMVTAALTAVCAVFKVSWDAKDEPFAKRLTETIKNAGFISTGFKNVGAFGVSIYNVLITVFSWLYKKVTGKEWQSLNDDFTKEVFVVHANLQFYNGDLGKASMYKYSEHRKNAQEIIERATRLLLRIFSLSDKHLSNKFTSLIQPNMEKLQHNLATAYHLSGQEVMERVSPFVVSLVGDSGAGKTELAKVLARKLNEEVFKEEGDKINNVYAWDPNANFQDGYVDQKVAIVEEVNASQDVATVVPLLTLFSSSPMTVPKARLEQKGMACKIEAFVTTSNMISTVAEKMSAPKALDRRRHLVIKPVLKQGFYKDSNGKRVGLVDKIQSQSKEDIEKFAHVEFYLLSSLGDKTIDEDHWIHTIKGEDGQNAFQGTTIPVNFDTLMKIVLEGCMTHRAKESAISHTNPLKNAIQELEAIKDCLLGSMLSTKEIFGVKIAKEQYAMQITQILKEVDRINQQISHINAYRKRNEMEEVPTLIIPDFEAMIDAENKAKGTAGETINTKSKIEYINQGKLVSLAHPRYISDTAHLVVVSSSMEQYRSAEAIKQAEIEDRSNYKVYLPAKITDNNSAVSFLRHDLDLDFVRFVIPTQRTYVGWRGIDEMSYENVKFQPWFQESLEIWTTRFTPAQQAQICQWVMTDLEPIISQRVAFIKFWYKAKRQYNNIMSTCGDVIHSFFNIDFLTKSVLILCYGMCTTFMVCCTLALLSDILAPVQPTSGGAYAHNQSNHQAGKVAATGIPMMVAAKKASGTASLFDKPLPDNSRIIREKCQANMRLCLAEKAFQGVFLKSNIMLINAHVVHHIRNEGGLKILDINTGDYTFYEVPEHCIHLFGKKDQALVKIRNHTMCPDITKYIGTPSIYDINRSGITINYYTPSSVKKQVTLVSHVIHGELNVEMNWKVNDTISMGDALSYKFMAPFGSSGGIIFSNDTRDCNTPIIAVQSARVDGFKNKSFASVLSSDEIKEAVYKLIDFQYKSDQEIPDIQIAYGTDGECPQIFTSGDRQLNYIGMIDDPKYVASPYNELGYHKSPIYSVIGRFKPETRQPSIMNLSDARWVKFRSILVDPMQHSIMKTANDHVPLWPDHEIDCAVTALTEYLRGAVLCDSKPLRVFTIEEAIHNENNRINPHTSAGFPWKARLQGRGKEALFQFSNDPETPGEITFIDPRFYAECESTLADYRQGLIPPSTTYLFAKSELRPIEKLYKTRSIDVCSATTSVVFRQLHQDLTDRLIQTGDGTHPHCFGINVLSNHWINLANSLIATCPEHENPQCFDLDISNWDGHMTLQIALAVAEVCSRLYGDDHITRASMAHEMIGTYSQFGPAVFKKTRGMCSGWPGTTLYNTLGHILIGYMIYVRIMQKAKMTDKLSFNDWLFYTCPRYYGDDNITSVRPEIQGFYNGITVSKAYTEAGLPATPGTKTNEFVAFLPLSEVTFLKRHFVWDEQFHIWKAPLDIGVIYDMVRWIRASKKDIVRSQFVANFTDARREMCMHGAEEYEIFQTLCATAARNLGHPIHLPYHHYSHIMGEMLSHYYND